MRAGVALFAGLALLLASCAPRLGVAPTVDALASRYRAARSARAAALHAFTAELVVRADGRMVGRMPALAASLAVAAPDRVKVRASWLLGTAFEVVGLDDSLFAWVPSQRAGVALGGAGGAMGVQAPLALACRALGATWEPPADAWHHARAESTGFALAWREGGDSLQLHLDHDGLPLRVRLARQGGEVTVRYTAWERWRGAPWPERFEIADGSGWARLRIQMEQPHTSAIADPHWFALRVPGDARILGWDELRELLGFPGKEPGS